MKTLGVNETRAEFSKAISASQVEPVVIMSHGNPIAVVIGIKGTRVETLLTALPKLLKATISKITKGLPYECRTIYC